jgi:hypothetical protein
MKVKDTLRVDKIFYSLEYKMLNFLCDHKSRPYGTWEKIQYIKKNFPSWQYTGVAPFDDILEWCEEHFGNDWIWNYETIYFKTEPDRLVFALRWS